MKRSHLSPEYEDRILNADMLLSRGNLPASRAAIDEVVNELDCAGLYDTCDYAAALCTLASHYSIDNDWEKMDPVIERLMYITDEFGFPVEYARGLMLIAYRQMMCGEYDKAAENAKKALNLLMLRIVPEKSEYLYKYISMCNLYLSNLTDDYDEIMKYIDHAVIYASANTPLLDDLYVTVLAQKVYHMYTGMLVGKCQVTDVVKAYNEYWGLMLYYLHRYMDPETPETNAMLFEMERFYLVDMPSQVFLPILGMCSNEDITTWADALALFYDSMFVKKGLLRRVAQGYGDGKAPIDNPELTSCLELAKVLKVNEAAVEFVKVKVEDNKYQYIALMIYHGAMSLYPTIITDENDNIYDLDSEGNILDLIPVEEYLTTERLFNIIWKPILERVGPSAKVFFAPDGIMHKMAIEYLPYSEHLDPVCCVHPAWMLKRVPTTAQLIDERRNDDED